MRIKEDDHFAVNDTDYQYKRVLRRLIDRGEPREGRNGVTRSMFGANMRFDLKNGALPILTSKRVHTKSVIVELLWMLKGMSNVDYLHRYGVTIWDEWADADGELGPVYGKQWRSWRGSSPQDGSPRHVDQIAKVIEGIKKDPYGRRHIVTAWNPAEIDDMALPPCHCLFQFHVNSRGLACQLYQRSADWFLGVPFNMLSYALLTHLIGREVDIEPRAFIHTFGDYHLYENHLEAALELLERPDHYPTTRVAIKPKSIFDLEPDDFEIVNYESEGSIKAEVSV